MKNKIKENKDILIRIITILYYRISFLIGETGRKIKWAFQRAIRGYSNKDVWSIDCFLCDIMPKMLRQLAKNLNGCPTNLYDKKNEDDECHKWVKILEKMAEGFEAGQKINDMDFDNEQERKKLEKKFDKGMDLFKKYFFSLWD
jgi:hypothetical protein